MNDYKPFINNKIILTQTTLEILQPTPTKKELSKICTINIKYHQIRPINSSIKPINNYSLNMGNRPIIMDLALIIIKMVTCNTNKSNTQMEQILLAT